MDAFQISGFGEFKRAHLSFNPSMASFKNSRAILIAPSVLVPRKFKPCTRLGVVVWTKLILISFSRVARAWACAVIILFSFFRVHHGPGPRPFLDGAGAGMSLGNIRTQDVILPPIGGPAFRH